MRIPKRLPPLEYLKECFDYNPISGTLTWRERPVSHFISASEWKRFRTNFSGVEAGRVTTKGYKEVRLDGQYYQVHRIAYYIGCGEDSTKYVDHINGDTEDNRLCNLREATPTQNNHNRSISKRNTTGYKGVSIDSNTGRFKSSIRIGDGKRIFLGYFDTPDEANEAYQAAARKYHGEYAKLD